MPEAQASFKDVFDETAVAFLAGNLAAVLPSFPAKKFVEDVAADLPTLELKARSARIADGIRATLPGDYPAALDLVLKSLGTDEPAGGIEAMGGFRYMPLVNFVGRHGLDHPDESLAALPILTRFFSAEFDIRPFVLRHRDLAMAHVERWAGDADWRVRRLASEGIRPRLPWAMRLPEFIADPAPVLAIVDRLCADPNEIVRRSVANNLNDIAKDNPDAAIAAAKAWWKNHAARGTVRHGLRSLVKAGDAGALALLGFKGGADLSLTTFALAPKSIKLGEAVTFKTQLTNRARSSVHLSIDYAVHHRKANGGTTAKVFKWAVRTLAPGESCTLEKRHAIRPITTRRYYAGAHAIALLVNGRELARADFMLRV
jgi:3-methyladenine DNA glycosylase AlkC